MKKWRIVLSMMCEATGKIQQRYTDWHYARVICYITALNILVENRLEAEFLVSWGFEEG
jgi:hypothetical protein